MRSNLPYFKEVTTMKREELNALLEKCTTLEEIQDLGKQLGYKENWALHVFNARGGWQDRNPGVTDE